MLLEPLVNPPSSALPAGGDDRDRNDDDVLSADAEALAIRAGLDIVAVELAMEARIFHREQEWAGHGFARVDDYARERLGRTGRWLHDLAALGREIESLPELRWAILGGDGGKPIGRVAAMLVGRVATSETLGWWLAAARTLSVRQLREAVRGTHEGRAEDPGPRLLVKLPVPTEVKAAFEEAVELFRAVEGGEASVADFLDALCAEGEAGHEAPAESKEDRPVGSVRMWSHIPDVRADAATAGHGDVEARLRALVTLEDRLEKDLDRVLREMARNRGWSRLRFAGREHYAEERLGLSRRAVRRRAQAGRGLEKLPVLSDAYASGRLGLEAALHLVRLAGEGEWDDDVQRSWLARACAATVKRLRDEAREVTRVGVALPLTDGAWHASLRREPGRSRERVLAVGRLAAARSTSSVFLRLRLPEEVARRFLSAIDGAWPGLQALLEEFVHVWDDPAGTPRRKGDEVYVRDGWRCMAPGCTSRRNLESHHVKYRRCGGGDGLDNLVCLCRFHHLRGEHGGLASCRGSAPLGLVWRLGTSKKGLWYQNERRVSTTC